MKYAKQELDRMFTPAKVKELEAIVGKKAAAEIIEQLYAQLGSKSKEQALGVGYKASGTDAPNVDFALALLEEAKPLYLDNGKVKTLVALLGPETALNVLKILNGIKLPAKPSGTEKLEPATEATPAKKSTGKSVVDQITGPASVTKEKSLVGDMAANPGSESGSQKSIGKSVVERMADGDAV